MRHFELQQQIMRKISGTNFHDQLLLTLFEVFANSYVQSFLDNPDACKPLGFHPLDDTLNDPFEEMKVRTRKLRRKDQHEDRIEHFHLEGLSNSLNAIANSFSNLHRSGHAIS